MADESARALRNGVSSEVRGLGRRKVAAILCALLLMVGLCTGAILLMLHHLESRNAAFEPPMTDLERQQLLPAEPRLEASPSLDGLRYKQRSTTDANETGDATDLSLQHAHVDAAVSGSTLMHGQHRGY